MNGYRAEIKAPVRWVIRDGKKILQQARQCSDLVTAWTMWEDVPIVDEQTNNTKKD